MRCLGSALHPFRLGATGLIVGSGVIRKAALTVEMGVKRTNVPRSGKREVVAAARELWVGNLPTILIASRLRVSAPTVTRWAKRHGWLRPRDMPDPFGRVRPRRRRRRAAEA